MEMSTDVTQIRQLQDQLAHLGSVIGSLSHGIKGLLTGLDGGMYLLDSGFAKDDMPRIKEGWDLVRLMIGRIRSLVGEMLIYAKGEDIPLEKTDALSFAQDLETVHRPKTDRAGIDLECQFDPDLKHYHLDVGMARAIMSNILDNALEACQTDPDSVKKHVIRFTAQGKTDGILFKVIDNGPGMGADMQSKIFTPHFLSNKENGSGLGLYLAHRLLAQHQGRISVDSSTGQGACFSVYLPRSDSDGRGLGQNAPAA
jgi:signal transduction histidine kinase